jgi:hypothetical protein
MKLDYIDAVITNVPVNPLVWGVRVDSSPENKLFVEIMKISEKGTRYLGSLPRRYKKPVVCVRWHMRAGKDAFEDMLIEAGVPIYDTPEQCARAMYGLVRYGEIRRRA